MDPTETLYRIRQTTCKDPPSQSYQLSQDPYSDPTSWNKIPTGIILPAVIGSPQGSRKLQ
eukprot:6943277-Pyramimonas_sp.AAC.1